MIIIYDRLLETINIFVACITWMATTKTTEVTWLNLSTGVNQFRLQKHCSQQHYPISLHHCGLLIKQKVTVLCKPFLLLMCGSNYFRRLLYQDINAQQLHVIFMSFLIMGWEQATAKSNNLPHEIRIGTSRCVFLLQVLIDSQVS